MRSAEQLFAAMPAAKGRRECWLAWIRLIQGETIDWALGELEGFGYDETSECEHKQRVYNVAARLKRGEPTDTADGWQYRIENESANG